MEKKPQPCSRREIGPACLHHPAPTVPVTDSMDFHPVLQEKSPSWGVFLKMHHDYCSKGVKFLTIFEAL